MGWALFRLAPRVGSKHLSIALIFLMMFAAAGFLLQSRLVWRRVFGVLLVASAVVLAVLDSRSSYLTLIAGAVLLMVVTSRHKEWLKEYLWLSKPSRVVVGTAIAALLLVALSAGYHRYIRIPQAVHLAMKGEQHQAWITPSTFASELCPVPGEECLADASIYLRLSWVIYGLEKLVEHPLGIGPVSNPLRTLLQRDFPLIAANTTYDEFHSEVLNVLVCFGIPGVALLLVLYSLFVRRIIVIWSQRPPDALQVALLFGVLTCMVRTFLDSASPGLWYAYMGIAGMLSGLAGLTLSRTGAEKGEIMPAINSSRQAPS
jgi:O-antigen ligase